MLAADRQKIILEMVREAGSVQVEELAQKLQVSAMTIRRDLVKLQKEDMLKRCHGGAVIHEEADYVEKQAENVSEKQQLAMRCRSLVKKGDTIFLDAGTTTYEIAKQIKDIPEILIVTNDLEIAGLLKNSEAEVYICGGKIQKSTGSMFDSYALKMLQDFRFDIGFFGAASINDDFDTMTPTVDKMWLKRETPKQCRQSYLVVDASKFGKHAMTRIMHLKEYTGIVTNKTFNEEEMTKLQEKHVNLLSI